jgi:hypothetical protein
MKAELSKAFEELPLKEQQGLVQSFMKHDAWVRLEGVMKAQVQARIGVVLGSALSTDKGVYEQEFMKGEISALNLVLALPALLLEGIELELARVKQEEDENASKPKT